MEEIIMENNVLEVGWVFDTATTPIINIVQSEEKPQEEKNKELFELTDTYEDFLSWAETLGKDV